MYLKYFKYVMQHKINVFKCCINKAKIKWNDNEKDMALMLFIHAFTHDMSKFRPSEFISYAKWFYGKYGVNLKIGELTILDNAFLAAKKKQETKQKFDTAWIKHYSRNKHHWNYWENNVMPYKNILQMVCDWEAMGINFGNSAKEYYIKNCDKIKLHSQSKLIIEWELGLCDCEVW